ncbi:hypothetical protein LTR17_022377 [Elasticomyces elasticus]|nr:hypothetical protein LTR17_022377 [Elasticomyces elasticus]
MEESPNGKTKTYHVEQSRLDPEANMKISGTEGNLVYDDQDREPEIYVRTWVAVLAMFVLNFVQIIALQGPPVVLANIGESLHNTPTQTWVPNALSLVQAVLAPIISSASDTFQARKSIMVGSFVLSFIGSAIAPGAGSIYRLIVAQILIGFGFASTALAYSVPSEILPKKWRPLVQAGVNVAAAIGACVGPLVIGTLTRSDPIGGWRNFYWVQMALWGMTAIGIFFGYRPPTRHTAYDHLSLAQKIRALDLPGVFLFAAGLTLFLAGLGLGGGLFSWTNVRVLVTLILGLVTLLACGYWSVRVKSIRVPLFTGFVVFTAGIVGFATIQPGDSTRACIFAGLAGIGFGAPLVLIIAGIQLVIPHALIATGTALVIASRAVSSSVFTAIYSAALTERLDPKIISYVSKAAVSHGLPVISVKAFAEAIVAKEPKSLAQVAGVTPAIAQAGVVAVKQAFADSICVLFIIAAPFGVVACLLCFLLADQSDAMTYRVDAPMENLHARRK